METSDDENLGGGINRVVRLGDTVRRPVGPWSSSVHELLLHLENVGFAGAPRFLGIDEQGREILSLVPGESAWPPPLDLPLLESAASLLRTYHDAVAGWSPASPPAWQRDLAYLAYTMVPLAAPANLGPMGWPADLGKGDRLAGIRRGYGCTPAQFTELLDVVPMRVRGAYDTMRTWAAEDRPGWKAQWEQADPWRHGSGFLRDLDYLSGWDLGSDSEG